MGRVPGGMSHRRCGRTSPASRALAPNQDVGPVDHVGGSLLREDPLEMVPPGAPVRGSHPQRDGAVMTEDAMPPKHRLTETHEHIARVGHILTGRAIPSTDELLRLMPFFGDNLP